MQPTFNDFQNNIKNDNSDTFWLILADYCDENDISHDIREQIDTSHPEIWCFEWGGQSGPGIGGTGDPVGSCFVSGVGNPGIGGAGDSVGSESTVGSSSGITNGPSFHSRVGSY